jgi:hypothetical protein
MPLGRRDPAQERGGGEQPDSDHEEPPLPVQVAEAASEEQKPAEGEQVAVDDPGERGLREAEAVTDRRERDVHDRRVEHDHQRPQAKHVEREPALAAIGHLGLLSVGVTGADRTAGRKSSVGG